MNKKVARILVLELDFMPSRYRWAVDFFPVEGDHVMDLTRFFPSENLAIDFATMTAVGYGLVKTSEHTWGLPPGQTSQGM